jgi:hypothetical protein
MAPGVTFWDAGEFIAAAKVLGIPHPPGTPMFVVPLHVWAQVLWFLPYAVATNLFSAFCTGVAGGLAAFFVGRAVGAVKNAPWIGLAAGLTSGAMSTVWSNATETEVYAASLLLVMMTIVAADVAGRTGDPRWLTLTAYLIAFAVPLHTSALVAVPAVIWLVVDRGDNSFAWGIGGLLFGVATIAAGVSRWSAPLVAIGVVIIAVLGTLRRLQARESGRTALAALGVTVVALSALLFLLIRARHDPAINQGDPSSVRRLADAVSRAEYDVAGLWPRRAPVWLQISNWFEYADWQVALSFAPSVIPNVARVVATLVFAGLGVAGSFWHRETDRRTWRALLVLFVSGSLGVIVYLNLKAGTSFGYSFIPDGDAHEARDRDYFFVLGFWAWGLWAAMGAVRLAARFRFPPQAGVVFAALPLFLNWSAVNRRSEPESHLPSELARQMLDDLPERAILFAAGDNDTYPLWYEQQANGRRRDVTVVTLPLLEANWNFVEFGRRSGLDLGAMPAGAGARAKRIANVARASGRPIAVTIAVDGEDREVLGSGWTMKGLFAVSAAAPEDSNALDTLSAVMAVDTAAVSTTRDLIARRLGRLTVRESVDPVDDYAIRLLSCPRLVLLRNPSAAEIASLASFCNLR